MAPVGRRRSGMLYAIPNNSVVEEVNSFFRVEYLRTSSSLKSRSQNSVLKIQHSKGVPLASLNFERRNHMNGGGGENLLGRGLSVLFFVLLPAKLN